MSQEQSAEALRVLTRAGVPTDHASHAQRAFHELDALSTPAGWHGQNDIVTLDGLAGTYFWAENPLQPGRMEFRFEAGHVGSQGTYQLSSAFAPTEQGQFFCVPNNPAVGWAFISLLPTGGATRTFTIGGMLTDARWKILLLLLNRLGPHGPVSPAFSAMRER